MSKPVYVMSQVSSSRPPTWHIRGDGDKTLCGYTLEIKATQGEVPQLGVCPRCLNLQVMRSIQSQKGNQRK